MSLFRVGIIFGFLMVISLLGYGAPTANKVGAKKGSEVAKPAASAPANRNPANATSGSQPAETTTPVESSPPPKEAETKAAKEDSPAVKGVKKRGAEISGATKGEDGPASLFADEKGFLAGLDYPELQVVPRASERLTMEAQEERSAFMSHYWPVQISALALIMAGSTSSGNYREDSPTDSQKKENAFSSQMGLLIGGMWFGATYYLSHSLSYSKALPEIRKVTGKDKKSQLLRERLSEEALERPAKVARMINNMSVWSTLALAMYIDAHSKQSLPSYTGLAIGLSFLPWLIDNRIIENWDKHQEYKRKIYAPITKVDFVIDPKSGQATPLLGLQWRF
jgi:hypothetical protein